MEFRRVLFRSADDADAAGPGRGVRLGLDALPGASAPCAVRAEGQSDEGVAGEGGGCAGVSGFGVVVVAAHVLPAVVGVTVQEGQATAGGLGQLEGPFEVGGFEAGVTVHLAVALVGRSEEHTSE